MKRYIFGRSMSGIHFVQRRVMAHSYSDEDCGFFIKLVDLANIIDFFKPTMTTHDGGKTNICLSWRMSTIS